MILIFKFLFKICTVLVTSLPSCSHHNICGACVLQCAEGFLQAALKADTAMVMQQLGDGETAAKKSCKSATNSVSKTIQTSSE